MFANISGIMLLLFQASLLMQLIFLLPLAGADSGYFSSSLGPSVQKYAVGKLPQVSYELNPSWAGQIRVPGKKDDQLFFWLFEAESESQDLISMVILNES